ncbi:lysophospholipid acyltransferase family protein [Egibacter rhizosphaerae]|nr:lysophospholipid acyltransferase family protein [Egibacter rhizosphaerae]
MRHAHRLAAGRVVRRLRAEVEGLERVPDGGVLLASNHLSALDLYLLSAASPRPAHLIGKEELGRGPIGRFHRLMGMVPITRGSGDHGAIGAAIDLLARGEVVALFPEGTRSPDGRLYKFRSGAARIAAAGQVPVVPVTLLGTAEVWARGQRPRLRRPPAGQLRVVFGEPLSPPADRPRERRVFTRELRARVAAVTDQEPADAFAPVEDEDQRDAIET